MNNLPPAFWSRSAEEVLLDHKSSPQGLSSQEAKQRLAQYGANSLKQKKQSHSLSLLLNQFQSPIILILMGAAILSSFLGNTLESMIILAIGLFIAFLGFLQE